jgi:hypothetical protein
MAANVPDRSFHARLTGSPTTTLIGLWSIPGLGAFRAGIEREIVNDGSQSASSSSTSRLIWVSATTPR